MDYMREIFEKYSDMDSECGHDEEAMHEECWHSVMEGPKRIMLKDVEDYTAIYKELGRIAAGCLMWMKAIDAGKGNEVNS